MTRKNIKQNIIQNYLLTNFTGKKGSHITLWRQGRARLHEIITGFGRKTTDGAGNEKAETATLPFLGWAKINRKIDEDFVSTKALS